MAKKAKRPPTEADLALDNTDHDQFAAAMVVCQNSSGSCSWLGHCVLGDCFTDLGKLKRRRRYYQGKADELDRQIRKIEESRAAADCPEGPRIFH